MDQQRRVILFVALSMGVWIAYANLVLPFFLPVMPKQAPAELADAEDDAPVSALAPLNVVPEIADAAPAKPALVRHPLRSVELGSLDPASGFFLHVELTSRGAAVDTVTLNDPRYPEFGKRGTPLKLIGHDPAVDAKTFALDAPGLVAALNGQSTDEVTWEVVDDEATPVSATFRLRTGDGRFEIRKRYEIEKVPADKSVNNDLRDHWVNGYRLKLTVTAKNLGPNEQPWSYTLRGPAGLPLEDAANTYKYRDVQLGFLRTNGGIDASQFTAKTAVQEHRAAEKELAQLAKRALEENRPVDQLTSAKLSTWLRPLAYVGVDTNYFAALVQPGGDQLKSQTVASSRAEFLKSGRTDAQADISVLMTTTPVMLPAATAAGAEISHEYSLYSLPKRKALLSELKADPVLGYGWFQPIVEIMLWIFNTLHDVFGLSYGLAILGLTIIIRGLMFPLTRHQIRTMDRMKEHQPELKILHEKMKKDPESLTAEERRKMQEIQLKMMGGCLPLLLQMPIFIALYRALQVSVDLRMAPMHIFGNWIDNLASPDRLFPFGFEVPWLEWTEFNLLPILSVGLMIINQKMTMPPPVDEEQRIQQKTMNFTMGIMGILFYRMPSGLSLYIITSTLWGMIERAALKKFAPTAPAPVTTPAVTTAAATASKPATPEKAGWFGDFKQKLKEMQELADKQNSVKRDADRPNPTRDSRKGKRK